MSRCASHGELVGGYVLGALEPAEMDEMRRHVADCPSCAAEVRRLTPLPGLLDLVSPSDVPPPAASPEVEERILDRFARERPSATHPRRGRRFAAVAAALGVAVVALTLALFADGDSEERTGAYASALLTASDPGVKGRATAWVDAVPAGTRVRLEARGLERAGTVYALWCVRANGDWVSGGTFRSDADGRARAQLTAAVEPGDYHVIVVTRAARSGGDRGHGTPVLRGELRY